MQRLNKEYKLDFSKSINLIYGSVDRLNPQVIYVSGKTWVLPSTKGEYEKTISLILSRFKRTIRSSIFNSNFFTKKYICDFDVNTLSLNEGKKTFLSFDIFVKQKEMPIKELKTIKPYINDFCANIITNLEEEFEENEFSLSKSKQK